MRQSDVFEHLRTGRFSLGWHDTTADHGVVAGLTLQRRQSSDAYEISAVLFPYGLKAEDRGLICTKPLSHPLAGSSYYNNHAD